MSFLTTGRHRLDLVAPGVVTLDLVDADETDRPWRLETYADDADLGEPASAEALVPTLLQDGDKVRKTRDGNREIIWFVGVRGDTLRACGEGEKWLALGLNGATQLHYQPPEETAPVTVFDVLVGTMKLQYIDTEEAEHLYVYRVRLVCRPFARSRELKYAALEAGSGSVTTLDNASSVTKWGTYAGGAATMIGTATYLGESAIRYQLGPGVFFFPEAHIQWSDAIPGGTNYVAVDIASTPPPVGVEIVGASVLSSEVLTNGYTRYYAQVTNPAGIAAPLKIRASYNVNVQAPPFGTGAVDIYVGGLYTTSVVAQGGLFLGAIEGSQRTPARITITGDEGLVEACVYCDATMQTHGWVPDVPASWAAAPEDTYLFHLVSPVSASNGDIYTLEIGDQAPAVTTYRSGYPVLFVMHPGGNDSGRVGFIEPVVKKNGATVTTPVLRMFRQNEDASLTWIPDIVAEETLVIDLPRVGRERGGVYAEGRLVLDNAIAWSYPHVRPPFFGLWAAATGSDITDIELAYYACYHSLVAGA